MDPKTLRYSETHEWASLEGNLCTVGITQYAIEQLSDVTYIELPRVGKAVAQSGTFGVIESVKSANDLYSPVAGEVAEVNKALESDPTLVSQDCYGTGWIIKLRVAPGATLDHLLTHDEYQKQIASGGH
jgi:glycine cleavage system H protein